MKISSITKAALVTVLVLSASTAEARAKGRMDLVDRAVKAGDFTILVQAVQAAGLEEALRGDGPFTVYAPTDKAFENLLGELGLTPEELLADPNLAKILLYHVTPERLFSWHLARRSSVDTLAEVPIDVSATRGRRWWRPSIMLNDAKVVKTNIIASNGVIHVLDKVLLPPSDIVSVAKQAGGFDILLTALETAGLTEVLQGEGPFTVLAPTDEAFGNLLEALGITAEELLANPDLSTILLYHVIPGLALERDIVSLNEAETAAGLDVAISVKYRWFRRWRKIMVNDANVVKTDIIASNGVIHVIDKVLIPPENIVGVATGAGNFTILLAALEKTGLDEVLAGEGPFTVFAPPDEAFTALLGELGITADELLNDPGLSDILLYHVLPEKVSRKELLSLNSAVTAQGQPIDIDVKFRFRPFGREVMVNGIKVTATDILASNGYIHVIDGVLLPPEE